MAFARIVHTALDGATNQFDVTFPYISQSHVKVKVDGVATTAFTFITDTRIQMTSTPASGSDLIILRESSPTTRLVDYQTGSILSETILDTDSLQAFFLSQESQDIKEVALSKSDVNDQFDAGSKRIVNVADPTSAQDAATKAFVDSTLSNNAAQAAAASASAAAAATSETNAANSATASGNSATASANSAVEAANEVAVLAPRYKFSAATAVADPGVSFLRFNNSVAASSTIVIINEKTADAGNPDIEDWIKSWDDSTSTIKGYIRIVDPNAPANYVIYNITGLTDRVGHVELLVAHVDSNFVSGTTFVEDNTLRITFSRTGDLGQVGPQGIQGIQGNTGPQGPAATISVGSTATSAAGSNGVVTNSGTSGAAVLDFTVPRGAVGAAGSDGSDGADGTAATVAIGTVTTLAAGASATVTNVGSATSATLNFEIPRGATGQAGSGTGDLLASNNLSDIDSASAGRNNLGLGTSAVLNAGTAANNLVQLDATSKLPSVDGSQITGFSQNGVLVGNGSGAIGVTAVGTAGQVLTSNGSSAPTYQDAASGGGPGLDGGTAGEESVIRLNANQISGNANLTVLSGKNGMTAGPINITSGSTLTIQTGANWHLIGA